MGMNVVHSGDTFQIYGDALKTYTKLPAGTYEVCFNKFSGFFLTSHNDLVISEGKIYGCSEKKVQKVLTSFSKVDRNFGVILSGRKGIGKSLFARLLAVQARECEIPLILVTTYFPGIANFLSSIEQEVIVLFDEFEKTFADKDGVSPQEEMLPLFDGLDGGKKLFVVTCNEVNKLNTYLLNRPGRFHYHFMLTNPNPDEIREYLEDKLEEQYHPLIKKVVGFAANTNITYDILRAIAFELNNGYSFEETLVDLNISKEDAPRYDIVAELSDGSRWTCDNECIDMFSSEMHYYWLREPKTDKKLIRIDFEPADVGMDIESGEMVLDPELIDTFVDEDDFYLDKPEDKAKYDYLCGLTLKKVAFVRRAARNRLKFMV